MLPFAPDPDYMFKGLVQYLRVIVGLFPLMTGCTVFNVFSAMPVLIHLAVLARFILAMVLMFLHTEMAGNSCIIIVPSVFQLFLENLEHEDSFIYLSAIQGNSNVFYLARCDFIMNI